MQDISRISPTAEQHKLFSSVMDRMAQKVAEDEPTLGVEFPHVTTPSGAWVTWPASISAGYTGQAWSHGNWLCGFWVGLLLAANLHTGESRYLTWARERMRLVAQRADDPNTHDIGFIFDSSAIPGFMLTGDAWYAQFALAAAQRLRARLVGTRGGYYLASWGPLDDLRGRCSSAIDTMANLSLLYWAADYSKDDSFRLAAKAHADMTEKGFIRADWSTYHAVEYEVDSGRRVRGYTFQGAGDESAWSRGQGWAVYGFVHTARETGDPHYLSVAEKLSAYYEKRLDGRQVPPWDFDAVGADAGIKDTAAAAVMASAWLEMGRTHPDAGQGKSWATKGLAMLEALCQDEFAFEAEHRGLLRNSCYSKPHNEGVQSATMFGDFFFVEALCRVLYPGKFRKA